MLSIQYSVNKRDSYPSSYPFIPHIASTVFQEASAFRIGQRRRAKVEFIHKERRLKTKLRVVTKQRDTYVQYALHLEEDLAAVKAGQDCLITIKVENDQLRATVDKYQAIISEQAAVVSDLENAREVDQETIKTLRGKRLTDRSTVDSWQKEIEELKQINEHLCEENDGFQATIEELSSTVAEKDQQLLDLRRQNTETIASRNQSQEQVTEQKRHLDEALKQLKKQRNINRKLACTLHDKEKSWKIQAEKLMYDVNFAKAETSNNLKVYQEVFCLKDVYIKHLDNANQVRISPDQTPNDFQILLQVIEGCQQEVRNRDRSITMLKTDIQNLLTTKQQDFDQLTTYLNENRELRAQRNDAEAKVEQIQGQLDRKNIFVTKLQKIITHEVDITGISTEDHAIPATAIKAMIAHATAEYHTEMEALRHEIQQERNKLQELRTTYDKCDNDLFEHRLEEQFRQDEVNKLRFEITTLKEQKMFMKEQHQVYSNLTSMCQKSQHRQVQEVAAFVQTRLRPLYIRNEQLLAEKVALNEEVEKRRSDMEADFAKISRKYMIANSAYEEIATLYWDTAIHQHDQLHEELAKYKRKCGVEHYVESRPASRLVHERRLLQYALAKTAGMDRDILPREYLDPNFLKTCHPAVIQALQKLWPDLWRWHQGQAAWIPLTVPLLTAAGPIILDDNTLAVSNARLEEFKKELDELDNALEENHHELFNTRPERYNPHSSSSPHSQGDSDSDNHNSSLNEPTTRSTTPPSDHTNDTSPSQSVAGDLQPMATHDRVDSKYNNEISQLMTKEQYDALPAFAKTKAVVLSGQMKENVQLAGYVNENEIDEDAFLAQYGRGIEDNNSGGRDQAADHGSRSDSALSSVGRPVVLEEPAVEHADAIDPLAWDEEAANFYTEWEYEKLDDEQKREYKRIVAAEASA